MNISKENPNYWQNKIAAWLNESPIKVFDIKNRDAVTKELYDSFSGLKSTANEELIITADHIASGLTRAVLPSDYSKLEEIRLNHPLVKEDGLSLDIKNVNTEVLKKELKTLFETDLAYLLKDTDSENRAKQIFNYLFFALNKQLRKNRTGEIGKVGAYWDILPADTRIPDHPMWHHFGMTSAIYSSLERNEKANTKENLSIVVYSITPVQEFIGKARKLRDYWTGSVLLSYLAFTGITKVCEELGPDHILYPSLQNQALMDIWLGKKDELLGKMLAEDNEVLKTLDSDSKSIAAFPNKFVFICNNKDVEEICAEIQKTIDSSWKETAGIVQDYIIKKTKSENPERFNSIWENTIDKYWKYSWASTNFVKLNNQEELKNLLSEQKWKNEYETMSSFIKFADESKNFVTKYDVSNLYGTTHSLVQGILAAGKNKPVFNNIKHSQNGEKCPLCGEGEVLNSSPTDIGAAEYNKNIKLFWDSLREKTNADGDNFNQVGKEERLCAVCSLKRFLPVALKDKNHILYSVLREPYEKNNFPSTTEMSAWEYLQNFKDNERKEIAEKLHDAEFETSDDNLSQILKNAKKYETKYYAFLLMDGDKMGDLINGETTEASWFDVLNIKNYSSSPFTNELKNKTRTINPALHAMISDSLNNFARYGVQPSIKKGNGRLIYAGGDDVCAILPLSTALKTADRIRQIYQLSYAEVEEDGSKSLIQNSELDSNVKEVSPELGKIVMHLGHSQKQDTTKISLSGAIIIAHHKTPLKEVISDAHHVLDSIAKDKSGRNSLAIRLKKRSGGDRDMWFKWEQKNIFADEERSCKQSFENVILNAKKKDLSTSLLYKIESIKSYIEPLIGDLDKNKSLILKLFEYEAAHSGFKNNAAEMAIDLAGICIKYKKVDGKNVALNEWYNPEAAIIANFIAQKKTKDEIEETGK